MNAIERDLINDDNVLALFYGGSIGSENTDLYSDIDLRVVVKPEKIEGYISNKINVLKAGEMFYFLKTCTPFRFIRLFTMNVSIPSN